jgi:hypothetical protein
MSDCTIGEIQKPHFAFGRMQRGDFGPAGGSYAAGPCPLVLQLRTCCCIAASEANGHQRISGCRRSAGPFKQTVVASRQSNMDLRAAAQSRESAAIK